MIADCPQITLINADFQSTFLKAGTDGPQITLITRITRGRF
jgi:hypothetical protein